MPLILDIQIVNLEEQLEQFREELENKNEEVQQLQMQLQIQLKESTTRQQELEQENKLFKVLSEKKPCFLSCFKQREFMKSEYYEKV